jgi:uncharacterized repeat protein (TIGR03803 family)
MENPRQSRTPICSSNLLSLLPVILAVVLFPSTGYTQTITFTYELHCDPSKDKDCYFGSMSLACSPGGIGRDHVKIAVLSSDVPGYTDPVPVDDGSLGWESSPATYTRSDSQDCLATYGNPGGSAGLAGSVFGLPGGSPLLSATFFGGASSDHFVGLVSGLDDFSGSIKVAAIDPTLLANLGMAGLPNYGVGELSDSFRYGGPWPPEFSYGVSVTFTPPATRVLHSFKGGTYGAQPVGGLSSDQNGYLYGTTLHGGAGFGTVFQLWHESSGWSYRTLYSFQGGTDGAYPITKVAVGADGSLYGTTTAGGNIACPNGCGTVFRLRHSATCQGPLCSWHETVLHRFKGGADGADPRGELIFDEAGDIYGTAYQGGNCGGSGGTCGVVYELTPSVGGWIETVLFRFTGGTEGKHPSSQLVFDSSGNLYSTTLYGGDLSCNSGLGCGTVFQLTPTGSAWTQNVLYRFGRFDGQPFGDLILDQSGDLYGAAKSAIFSLAQSGGIWTYNVISGTGSNDLSMDSSGNLYGVHASRYAGRIFKLTPSQGSWKQSVLANFSGSHEGGHPYADLVFDTKGNFYGVAYSGGENDQGVVFKMPNR